MAGLAEIIGTVRRNHALEHATISLLLGRLRHGVRLVSRAAADGFYVYGDVPRDQLEVSAKEALIRLQQGESHLAISPMCGTNLAVAGLLAGLSALVAVGNQNRAQRAPNVLLASILAVVAAQPLGRIVQRRFTTDADLSGIEIVGMSEGGRGPGRYYKVETVRRGP